MAQHRDIGQELLEALKLRYTAKLYEAKATLEVYLNNPAGIGEHPQILDEMDKQLEQYGTALDKLAVLGDLYSEDNLTVEDDDD